MPPYIMGPLIIFEKLVAIGKSLKKKDINLPMLYINTKRLVVSPGLVLLLSKSIAIAKANIAKNTS